MKDEKKEKLEAAGWVVGDANLFLGTQTCPMGHTYPIEKVVCPYCEGSKPRKKR